MLNIIEKNDENVRD